MPSYQSVAQNAPCYCFQVIEHSNYEVQPSEGENLLSSIGPCLYWLTIFFLILTCIVLGSKTMEES